MNPFHIMTVEMDVLAMMINVFQRVRDHPEMVWISGLSPDIKIGDLEVFMAFLRKDLLLAHKIQFYPALNAAF